VPRPLASIESSWWHAQATPFSRLASHVAGKLNVPVEAIVLRFDSEQVSLDSTPDDLDVTEDDALECFVRAT